MTSLFPLPSPTLPEFSTLLLTGPYHPSAPIHLCLTHLVNRPETKGVFFTPSRQPFLNAVRQFNDDWLNECGGYGAVSEILTRVNVLYPPSPVHLALLLSTLKVAGPLDNLALTAKVPLDSTPSLVVLYELSLYFLDEKASDSHTLSSYLSLVAGALTALETLGSNGDLVQLILMDSRLDELKLPVLKRPSHIPDEDDSSWTSYKVSFLVQRYFEWHGRFETILSPESPVAPEQDAPQPSASGTTHRLHLCKTNENEDSESSNVWEWVVKDGRGLHSFTAVFLRYLETMSSELTPSSFEPQSDTSFFANILTPGSSLHPTFLFILDFVLAFLAFTFVSLIVLTGGNIHVIALLVIELGLWASIKWFVHELKNAPSEEAGEAASNKKKST
ncbi:hypothetical protein OF83DRAFT_1169176 [Amylostereum chailletii]|nr:hypothetical protein OF83DRAFT_1169176 [Amylostereum chailletii]